MDAALELAQHPRLRPLLLLRVCALLGVVLRDTPSLAADGALLLRVEQVVEVVPLIKHINRITFEEGSALSRLAQSEASPVRAIELLHRACDKYKQSNRARPNDARTLYNWGQTLALLAERVVQLLLEGRTHLLQPRRHRAMVDHPHDDQGTVPTVPEAASSTTVEHCDGTVQAEDDKDGAEKEKDTEDTEEEEIKEKANEAEEEQALAAAGAARGRAMVRTAWSEALRLYSSALVLDGDDWHALMYSGDLLAMQADWGRMVGIAQHPVALLRRAVRHYAQSMQAVGGSADPSRTRQVVESCPFRLLYGAGTAHLKLATLLRSESRVEKRYVTIPYAVSHTRHAGAVQQLSAYR